MERGLKKLAEVDGRAGEEVGNSLNAIFPDLGRYMVEYVFGDIYCRDGLALKSKEVAVVAALTAMGTAEPQLRVHINAALNVGCAISEVQEIILQMSAYAGFPASINGMNALQGVLQERRRQGLEDSPGAGPATAVLPADRYEAGVRQLAVLDARQLARLKEAYDDISPDLVRLIVCSLADISTRDNLDIKHREMATIAALTALGNARPQLKFHINAGLNVGITITEVREIMLLMSVYCGFPSAINGTNVLKEVVDEREGDVADTMLV